MASNIETIDHEWVADLWPEPYQFTHALGIAKGDIQVHNYDVVPRTFQGLLAWAFVGHNPTALDMTRTVLLQYLHPPVYPNMPPKIFPVGVRVQGFVDSVNLRPLGNWTRGSSPSSALQHISLSGAGKYEAQFTHYVSAVNNIILFIYRSLNGTPPNDNFLSQNSLFIARRVFTKVTSMNRDMPSMLNAEDDPMQEARFVEDTWKVTEKLNSGMFIADEVDASDGTFVAMNPLNVEPGDFVDVCLSFDIVTKSQRNSHAFPVKVHLKLEHVLMLVPAQRVEKVPEYFNEHTVHGPGLRFF